MEEFFEIIFTHFDDGWNKIHTTYYSLRGKALKKISTEKLSRFS